MKIIEKEDDKLITFSKRRSEIYKKISEITTLCGIDVLSICFSPAGKPFSFGHPSIESMANRFLNNNIFPPDGNPHPLGELEVQMKNQLATDSIEGWPNENSFPAGEKQIKRTSVPQSVVISLIFLYIPDLRFENVINLSSSFSIAFISIFFLLPVFFPELAIAIKDMRTKETIKKNIKKE
ncbi:hypothetical protein GQ457_02G041950 [Hibiscus cannabinus]